MGPKRARPRAAICSHRLLTANRLRGLRQHHGFGGSVGAYLLQHAQPVPIVPAFHNLAIDDSRDRGSSNSDAFACCWYSEAVPFVGASGGPAYGYFVVNSKSILYYHLCVRERFANTLGKRNETFRACNFLVRCNLTLQPRVGGEKLADRLVVTFPPYFAVPALHQGNVV